MNINEKIKNNELSSSEIMTSPKSDEPIQAAQVKTKYWVHKDGWIYVGDKIEGARAAKKGEIDTHLETLEAISYSA
ncbi:hypothetical protein [Yersinia similis]|uniref:hypothetical protein n=1 Tax=Yersinia similis TaxID=367190 RepID=UPI00384B3929